MSDSLMASLAAAAEAAVAPPVPAPAPAATPAPAPAPAPATEAALVVAQRTGAAAERARIAAILDHPDATGREALARYFALHTDMDPAAVAGALAAAPKAGAAGADPVAALAAVVQSPRLGPPPAAVPAAQAETAKVDAAWKRVTDNINAGR